MLHGSATEIGRVAVALLVTALASTLCLQAAVLAGPPLPAKPLVEVRSVGVAAEAREGASRRGMVEVLDQLQRDLGDRLSTLLAQSGRIVPVGRHDPREQRTSDSFDVPVAPDPVATGAYRLDVVIEAFASVHGDGEAALDPKPLESPNSTIELVATIQVHGADGAMLDRETVMLKVPLQGDGLASFVASELAGRLANVVMDWIGPARVLGCSGGLVTFNRGLEAGVAAGQWWQAVHIRDAAAETGSHERALPEEIPIGWVRVEAVRPRMCRAVVIQDFGIDRGTILRLVPDGPPADVVAAETDRVVQPVNSAPESPAPAERAVPANSGGGEQGEPPAPALSTPAILAVFVQDVAAEVPEQKLELLQEELASHLGRDPVSLVPSPRVFEAVEAIPEDQRRGSILDARNTRVERVLAEPDAARQLAGALGADGIVLVTIDQYINTPRRARDRGTGQEVDLILTNLGVSWSLYCAGGSVVEQGGSVLRGQTLASEESQRSESSIDRQLRNAAARIAPNILAALAKDSARPAGEPAPEVAVAVAARLIDLSVPEVIERDGEWLLTPERLPLSLRRCQVIVDGVAVAEAPGEIQSAAGVHRLRVERPDVNAEERFFIPRDGLAIEVPVRLDAEVRRLLEAESAFLRTLEPGKPLSDAERDHFRRYADLLRQSGIMLGPVEAQGPDGRPSVWGQLLGP